MKRSDKYSTKLRTNHKNLTDTDFCYVYGNNIEFDFCVPILFLIKLLQVHIVVACFICCWLRNKDAHSKANSTFIPSDYKLSLNLDHTHLKLSEKLDENYVEIHVEIKNVKISNILEGVNSSIEGGR